MSSMTAWFSTATLILWLLPLPLLTAEFIRTGSRWRLVQAGTLLGLALLEILGQATGARWGTKAYDLVDFTAQGIGLLAIAHSLAESSLIRSSALRTTRALTIAMAVAAPVVVLLKKVGWDEVAVPLWSLGIALMMSLTAVARLDAPQRILRLLTSLAFLASMDSSGARPLYAVFLASTLAWSAIRSISESDSVRRRLARQRAFPKIFEKPEEPSPEAGDVLVEDTLAPILESAQQGASAEGGAVFLYREETDPAVGTTSRGLACVHAAGALSSLRGAGRAQTSRLLAQGLLARLTERGQAALSIRAEEELDLTRDLRVAHLAAAEIRSKDRALGLLVLGCRGERGFQPQDLSLLEVLAAQAAFGLLHQRVYQKVLGQSRFSRELEIAARIQRGLLPREMPKAVNLEIAATMQPAREIGGDYFDLIPISDDRLVVVIGDVSGKGLPAGMIMLIVRTILHLLVETQSSPSWLVSSLNARLAPQLDSRTFITLLCLRWNGRERQLSWTGAGHEHMLWWSEREGFLRRIRGGGVALGLRENISGFISESRLDLNAGDVVLLYTDGVTEARDPQGEEFGIEALEESLRRLHQEAPEAILAGILKDVETHAAGTPPGDDRTLLVLKVL